MPTGKDLLHLGFSLLGFYVVMWITLSIILLLGGPKLLLVLVGPVPAFLVGAKIYRKFSRDDW